MAKRKYGIGFHLPQPECTIVTSTSILNFIDIKCATPSSPSHHFVITSGNLLCCGIRTTNRNVAVWSSG